MANFRIGGTTGASKNLNARVLPDGTAVRVVGADFIDSQFTRVIQKGPKAGTEEPQVELRLQLQTLSSGTTVAEAKVAAQPYNEGATFDHYLGGVYKNDDGTFYVSGTAKAGRFLQGLAEIGITAPAGEVKGYVGAEFKLQREMVRTPKGVFNQPKPLPLAPTTVKAPTATVAAKAPVAVNAFAALKPEDQQAIVDALKESGSVSASELVDANIATNEEHAKAILATAPSAKLVRKA